MKKMCCEIYWAKVGIRKGNDKNFVKPLKTYKDGYLEQFSQLQL